MLRNCLLIAICFLWAGASSAEMTSIKTAYGTDFNAYVAGPEDAEIGILLAHDRWGLTQEAKNWADRFAEQGFRVVVADLYDGRPVHRESMAKMVMAQTDPEWVRADIEGSLNYLGKHQRKIAVMGWGYGAEHLYKIASRGDADIDALIAFYALPSGNQKALEAIDIPILGVFGRRDRVLNTERIDDFQVLMLRLRKSLEVVSVNADAGFANPKNATYQQAASNKAWFATEAFLKRHLLDE